ncbi:alpha/beta hydrolase [Microcoleus sp. FACHB-1515]|uniref:alpha/beta hydrolase n=1 Tax=Cyanophyceae TaxID=3028117 RepID=UPI001682C605|nr:alpha/beta hydrolase [Microcoleus sp. FACHB-1515]MBD2090182.1 alpha/beta hydrolase [Microcoleus sp. FACHB-1515]
MEFSKLRSRLIALGVGIGAALLIGQAPPAQAAEQIVLTYGSLYRSISVAELTEFAETGRLSSGLRFYLNLANIEPEVFRTILNEDLRLRLGFVDSALNSLPGEFALYQVGQVVHTSSRRANIQALRSALVLSVSEDNRVSLLEFLQNYPTQQLYVDGVRLAQVAQDVGEVVEDVRLRLQVIVAAVEEILPGLVCDCDAPASPRPQPR